MKNIYYTLLLLISGVQPLVSDAQILQGGSSFRDAVKEITDIATNSLIPLLFAAALAYFIWGIANFIRTADNPEERKKGKQQIIWGIIALTAMVGYFALTSVFTNTFFQRNAALPQLFQSN
ncbi:MAG: pilin [Candidatus Pacebacteria bacterium]|nr:pilin [Candidatus Paceibacterota bacterium]